MKKKTKEPVDIDITKLLLDPSLLTFKKTLDFRNVI
jgi:hypothetical protein